MRAHRWIRLCSRLHRCARMAYVCRLVYDDQKREVINFGKYKGRLAEDVLRTDPGYYAWIMQGDFTKNTKDVFTRIKLRMSK